MSGCVQKYWEKKKKKLPLLFGRSDAWLGMLRTNVARQYDFATEIGWWPRRTKYSYRRHAGGLCNVR